MYKTKILGCGRFGRNNEKKMCRVVPNGVNVSNRWPAVSLPLQQPFD